MTKLYVLLVLVLTLFSGHNSYGNVVDFSCAKSGNKNKSRDAFLTTEVEKNNETFILICSAEELVELSRRRGLFARSFLLGKDIDLKNYKGKKQFSIGIGALELERGFPFTGIFDGGGFSIKNFSFKQTGGEAFFNGLFAFAYGATLRNLKLIYPTVEGKFYNGALWGKGVALTVDNITIIGGRVGGHKMTGLLGGTHLYPNDRDKKESPMVKEQQGLITNITLIGGVKNGDAHLGGIVGHNNYPISNVKSFVQFYSKSTAHGLAVGYNDGGKLDNIVVARLKNTERQSLFTKFVDQFFECKKDFVSYLLLLCDPLPTVGNYMRGNNITFYKSVTVLEGDEALEALEQELGDFEMKDIKVGKSCALSLFDNPLNIFTDRCIPLFFQNYGGRIED